MILFELRCSQGHQFEAWFRDGAAYESQAAGGEIACPICGDAEVAKAVMAPRLAKRQEAPAEQRASEVAREILDAVEQIQDYVEENCDYVGERFAEVARQIHYGETEKRGIYGEATEEEADALAEEDIPVQRVPWRRKHS